MASLNPLLEISGEKSDGGHAVGKDPRKVPSDELARLFRERSPLRALRARCIGCSAGNSSEVRKCVSVTCPAWPFRMGKNPFRTPMSDAERNRRAARLNSSPQRNCADQTPARAVGAELKRKACRNAEHTPPID